MDLDGCQVRLIPVIQPLPSHRHLPMAKHQHRVVKLAHREISQPRYSGGPALSVGKIRTERADPGLAPSLPRLIDDQESKPTYI